MRKLSGLIHESRERVETTARQNLQRNWQNGRLWWNDPDAVVLMGDLPENEFRFHATAIYATGGMILSGDDLTRITAGRLAMLRQLQPPTGVAARFADDSFRVGTIKLPGRNVFCLFNWDNAVQRISFRLPVTSTVTDFWSGENLGEHAGDFVIDIPPHSARLLVCSSEVEIGPIGQIDPILFLKK